METSILTLVLVILWQGSTASLCGYAHDDSVKRNAYLQVSLLTSFSGLGISMCERKCSSVIGSRSYNYFRPDGKCECLSENSATSGQALVARKGWHHGDLDAAQEESDNDCSCPYGHSCYLDLPGLIRCPVQCAPPPPLDNADTIMELHAGKARVTYECLEDFRFIGNSSHMTCTYSLQWEGLSGSCKRVSWTNVTLTPTSGQPDTKWLWIPAPVGPGWKVEVIGTPTQPVKSAINLHSSVVGRFTFDMRIDYYGRQFYTEMSTYFNGTWSIPIDLEDAPWRNGTTFNVTIVINSALTDYEIYHDGAFYTNYTCWEACVPLNVVILSYHMFANSVRMIYP